MATATAKTTNKQSALSTQPSALSETKCNNKCRPSDSVPCRKRFRSFNTLLPQAEVERSDNTKKLLASYCWLHLKPTKCIFSSAPFDFAAAARKPSAETRAPWLSPMLTT
jgi:hypothetical protein